MALDPRLARARLRDTGQVEQEFDTPSAAAAWIRSLEAVVDPELLDIGLAKINNRFKVTIRWRKS